MQFDISIIIVNYNGLRYLHELFHSISELNLGGLKVEVVVVDNNSADGSIEYIEKHVNNIENLKLVKNNTNEGFANGNNIGVNNASGEYVVLLNNDTKVDQNWLQNLYSCHKMHKAGITTSKLLFFNNFIKVTASTQDKFTISSTYHINGDQKTIVPKFCKNVLHHGEEITCFGHSEIFLPVESTERYLNYSFKAHCLHNDASDILAINSNSATFQSSSLSFDLDMQSAPTVTIIQNAGSDINDKFNGYDIGFGEVDTGQYNQEAERNLACGAAMMIERELFLSVGSFDKNFFAYYEDTDLSYRVRKAGKKIIYCPSAIVRHVHTGTSKEWSPFFIFLVTRNRLWFILKNISKKRFTAELTNTIITVSKDAVLCKMKPKMFFIYIQSLLSCLKKVPHYLINN